MKKIPVILALAILGVIIFCTSHSSRRPKPFERNMIVTGYCKCSECCGWQRNWYGRAVYSYGKFKGKPKRVGITASGTRAHIGTIAADTSRYPFGTSIYIEGYGYGKVEDIGGDIKGDHIDLYFQTHRKAQEWGRKNMCVTVWPRAGSR